MICSRKIKNVENALKILQKDHGVNKVQGLVCHVSKKDDRSNLIEQVCFHYFRIQRKFIIKNTYVKLQYLF